MNLEELERKAKAAIASGQPSYDHGDYVDAVMQLVKDDPATVLKLIRLARIGEEYEDGMQSLYDPGAHEES